VNAQRRAAHAHTVTCVQRDRAVPSNRLGHKSIHASQILEYQRPGLVVHEPRMVRVDIGVVENDVVREAAP
jgi:hypothetical protein